MGAFAVCSTKPDQGNLKNWACDLLNLTARKFKSTLGHMGARVEPLHWLRREENLNLSQGRNASAFVPLPIILTLKLLVQGH